MIFQNVIPVQAVKPIQPQPESTNLKVTVEFTDDSNPDHSTGLMSPEVSILTRMVVL